MSSRRASSGISYPESAGGGAPRERYCEDCGEPAMTPSHPRCARCYKREQRGQSKVGERDRPLEFRPPLERLTEAAIRYRDADDADDEGWEDTRKDLAAAAVAYTRHLVSMGKMDAAALGLGGQQLQRAARADRRAPPRRAKPTARPQPVQEWLPLVVRDEAGRRIPLSEEGAH
jgi:hypothetical protein